MTRLAPGRAWRIGLKYCGGCAPRYDRVEQVGVLKKMLAEAVILLSYEAENLDAVLIVAGCPTSCADTATFEPLPILRIRSEADARLFIDDMRANPYRDLTGSPLLVAKLF